MITQDTFNKTTVKTRHRQVLVLLLSAPYTNKEIAEKLSISPRTVKNYVSSIYKKFNCKSRVQFLLFLSKCRKKLPIDTKSLSKSEYKIAVATLDGLDSVGVAKRLKYSEHYVRSKRCTVYDKLGCDDLYDFLWRFTYAKDDASSQAN